MSSFEYDKTGRPIQHVVGTKDRPRGGGEYRRRQYEWGINSQLKRVTNELSGGSILYSYDSFGSLIGSKAGQFEKLFRVTDEVGNLYGDTWLYAYYGNGMLKKVVKPDRSGVSFLYDPFGRRIEKTVSQAGSENTLTKTGAGSTLEEAPWVQVGGGIIRKPFNKKQDSNLDAGAEQSLYVEESLEPKTEYRTVIRFLWSGNTLLHEWETGKEGKRKLRERDGENADDKTGAVVVEFIYDWAAPFHDGLTAVGNKGYFYFINADRKVISGPFEDFGSEVYTYMTAYTEYSEGYTAFF
ncbi:hypothetical protein A4V08_23135 [Lachnoclostridium sp. YL32]|nr:hypothetical protein A4V08_23135 [Lachnoclostridium sp. YL32]